MMPGAGVGLPHGIVLLDWSCQVKEAPIYCGAAWRYLPVGIKDFVRTEARRAWDWV